MLRKLHFGAIISLILGLAVIAILASGVVYAAPQYADTLTAWQALTAKMWDQGCRKFEPEFAEPLETKVYVSTAGIISGIMTSKIRAKCLIYAVKPVIVDQPTEPTPGVTRVTWDAPTTRIDGTALAVNQIAGYQIYMDGVQAGYTGALLFELQAAPGKHRFELRTIDTQGLPSPFSPALEITAR